MATLCLPGKVWWQGDVTLAGAGQWHGGPYSGAGGDRALTVTTIKRSETAVNRRSNISTYSESKMFSS